MKKLQDILFSSALVVAAGAGMASCSSSDDIAEAPVNPSFDGENVKTQFAINIATPVTQNKTRMTEGNTQNNNSNFLGMKNIYLVPLTVSAVDNLPTANDVASKVIPLDGITNTNNIGTADKITSSKSSTVYSDVNIPVGTNNFLFYGTAPIEAIKINYSDISSFTDGSYMKKNFAQGSVKQTLAAGSVGGFEFALNKLPIPSSSDESDLNKARNAFVSYLTNIAGTTYQDENSNTAKWCNYTATTDNLASQTLKQAYTNFITLKAGSGKSILEAVHRLCDAVYQISQSSTDSNEKKLAEAIIANATTSAEGFNAIYTAPSSTSSNDSKLEITSTNDIYTGFPTRNGFPEGCMVLTWTSASPAVPSYITYDAASTTTPSQSNNHMKVSSLAYPLPITYYCNTPLRASADAGTFTWPETTNNWDTENSWTGWGNVVQSTTRRIALQNNINYGVACLQTTVKSASTSLLDQKGATINLGSTTKADASTVYGFPVKGILIGGQPEKVEWNYVSTSDNHTGTIYDNFQGAGVKDIIATITGDGTNYTLVFDNYASTQENVKIAIELENNTGVDFAGVDGNIVAAGQRFYLIAELDPSSASTQIEWPTYGTGDLPTSYENRYPAMAKDTNGNNINRIFVQDFTTTANFTINSLKNAYVTIPDLRASKLELGLSVDLSWKTGLTFDVPID